MILENGNLEYIQRNKSKEGILHQKNIYYCELIFLSSGSKTFGGKSVMLGYGPCKSKTERVSHYSTPMTSFATNTLPDYKYENGIENVIANVSLFNSL